VVTNAASTKRVQPVAEHLGIPWIIRAAKPLPRGYRHAMGLLGTTPATTAMIGDQVFTDILGGNRLGLYTILVDPLPNAREALITRMVQRPLERVVGRVPKGRRRTTV
jgi:HAD superfamily phosphatase (TIGR01668 family)